VLSLSPIVEHFQMGAGQTFGWIAASLAADVRPSAA
jgi:hypothetical protein